MYLFSMVNVIRFRKMESPVTKDISYEDLKALLGKSQNLFLVDVRTKEEVDKGHIPGSVHIPLDTVAAAFAMVPEEFKAKYGVTKPPLDAPELVFHCQLGRRGAVATGKAYELGYVNARNYAGAYKEWSAKEGK
ncbi:thiosulfate:glutathione sulfurtransferase isoform X2 [Sander vitreus]